MKKTVLSLALLPLLSSLPALAQAPQGAPAGRGAQAAPPEIDKTPPIEDFKPSALNQAGNSIPRSTRKGAFAPPCARRMPRPCC